jgi:hypothetical protein
MPVVLTVLGDKVEAMFEGLPLVGAEAVSLVVFAAELRPFGRPPLLLDSAGMHLHSLIPGFDCSFLGKLLVFDQRVGSSPCKPLKIHSPYN